MVNEIRRIEDEGCRRRCFKDRSSTLFAMAKKLSEDFGAHVAVVAFSPKGEPRAFGSPTADSVLRTYLPEAALPPPSSGSSAETAGEAAARVASMRRGTEETKALVAGGRRDGEGQGGAGQRGEAELVGGGCGGSRRGGAARIRQGARDAQGRCPGPHRRDRISAPATAVEEEAAVVGILTSFILTCAIRFLLLLIRSTVY
jgi:hypothetical protein